MRDAWESAPMVFVCRPACPHCRSEQYTRVRTEPKESDGTVTQKAICRTCEKTFLIINETLPESGSEIVWPC